ncbi:beta-1,3-galactosyl-O-glycosyl-glycoprotein beta-1,6-N-acetylglucosaminyltransferase 4-like [Crassostrea virginica]
MVQRRFTTFFISSSFSIILIFTIHNIVWRNPHSIVGSFNKEADLNLQSVRRRLVHDVDCRRIIEGDDTEIFFAAELMKRKEFNFITDDELRELAQNCEMFFKIFDYNRFIVSQEELDFPIAFSLIVHKNAVQIERLLRAIYRPHNVYCIHIDRKADSSLHDAIAAVIKCLPNVFIASKLENVIYAGYSRLQADINCMYDLLHYSGVKWKYFINLPAQEYPLKTNAEIVKILKLLNGTCSIESKYHKVFHYRVTQSYWENPKTLKVERRYLRKSPPPHNMTVGKGSAYGAFSRRFVEFALNDERAQDLLKWTEDTYSPDETFWATLAINKHLGTPGIKYTASGVPDRRVWMTTNVAWGYRGNPGCFGQYVREVCVYGVGDLQRLVTEREFFANKFYHDFQPYALMCLEEWLFNKSATTLPFELYYYKKLINPTRYMIRVNLKKRLN